MNSPRIGWNATLLNRMEWLGFALIISGFTTIFYAITMVFDLHSFAILMDPVRVESFARLVLDYPVLTSPLTLSFLYIRVNRAAQKVNNAFPMTKIYSAKYMQALVIASVIPSYLSLILKALL